MFLGYPYDIWVVSFLGALVGLKFAPVKSIVNAVVDIACSVFVGVHLTKLIGHILVFTIGYIGAVAFFSALFSLDLIRNIKNLIKGDFIEKQIDKGFDKILAVFDFFKRKD